MRKSEGFAVPAHVQRDFSGNLLEKPADKAWCYQSARGFQRHTLRIAREESVRSESALLREALVLPITPSDFAGHRIADAGPPAAARLQD